MADTTSDILAALDACGARVELHDGRLILHTGSQPVPSQLLARLRAAKGELTELLPLDPPPQEELLLPEPEVASSFHDNPPDFAEYEKRNSAEDSVSCTSHSSCAAALAPSPAPYLVLGDALSGERCTLCGSGRDVRRIRYGGEMRLWHVVCADRYISTVAHPTVKPPETASDPVGATPLRTVAAPPPRSPQTPGSPEPGDRAALEPARLANGCFLWRFVAGAPSDIAVLPLMLRARNRGAQLVRDGGTLVVSCRQELHSEVLRGLERHAAAVLAQLSKEGDQRIARWQRGEPSDVIDVLGLAPPKEQ